MKMIDRLKKLSLVQIWGLALGLNSLVLLTIFMIMNQEPSPPPRLLNISHLGDAADALAWQALAKDYNAQHPGVEVIITHLGGSEMSSLVTTLSPNWEAVIGPDSWVHAGVEEGRIQSLTWALYEFGYFSLFYDRDQVSHPAASWDELGQAVMTRADRSKLRYGLAMSEDAQDAWPFFSDRWRSEQNGPKSLDRQVTQDAFHTLSDLRFKYLVTPLSCNALCAANIFKEGRAPYALAGEWRLPEFQKALGKRLGIAALPRMKEHATLARRETQSLTIASRVQGESLVELKKFAEYLRSKKGSEDIFMKLGKLPSAIFDGKVKTEDALLHDLADAVRRSTFKTEAKAYATDLETLNLSLTRFFRGEWSTSEALAAVPGSGLLNEGVSP